jgi:hypothetical protein
LVAIFQVFFQTLPPIFRKFSPTKIRSLGRNILTLLAIPIIQNLSSELRLCVCGKLTAMAIWTALKNKFKSSNPANVDIVHCQYNNFVMGPNSTISTYINVLVNYRKHLRRLSDPISSSSLAACLPRGLPAHWTETVRTIRQITTDPDSIILKLKLEEAARISDQSAAEPHRLDSLTGNALIGHRFGEAPSTPVPAQNRVQPVDGSTHHTSPSRICCNCGAQITVCTNCHYPFHTKEECHKKGGGREGEPYVPRKNGTNTANTAAATPAKPITAPAALSIPLSDNTLALQRMNIILTTAPSALSLASTHKDNNTWILDSGCTTNMTHHRDWLVDFEPVTPIWFSSANGSFYTTGRGKVNATFTGQINHHWKSLSWTSFIREIFWSISLQFQQSLLAVPPATSLVITLRSHS